MSCFRKLAALVTISLLFIPSGCGDYAPESDAKQVNHLDWSVAGQWVDTCSCSIPCVCWIREVPTLGHCSEMFAFHIQEGHYGDTNLDNVYVVQVAESGKGKSTSQSRRDKDYAISNLYVDDSISDEVLDAVTKIFTRLAFSGDIAVKHSVKRVELSADISEEKAEVMIPGILHAEIFAHKDETEALKPFVHPTTNMPWIIQPAIQGESVVFSFDDDGVSWDIKGRHGTLAKFSYSSERGPLPWET